MDIQDLERIIPFSRGSTEIFKTGLWSPHKPRYVEKISPCRQACPIGIDMARAFVLASKGEIDQALSLVRQDNPLPGICGRVCYHPCELHCNRKGFDEALNIRGFERFLSDHGQIDLKGETPNRTKKERIAVIGSGPAGLSAAYQLIRMGYGVTVLEALPEPGGMLRYGIPEYRLPKKILRREIGLIQQLGVEIRTGIQVGRNISLAEIKNTFQAVFIAAGSHEGLKLRLDGEELPGVLEGIRFLRRINLGEKVKIGRRIVVIGGGNTAIDCARSARRLGAKSVAILYRRSESEMPAIPEDRVLATDEGIKIETLSGPKRLISEQGRLTGIECFRMELGAPDERGRPQAFPIKGSEYIVPVDTVIAAVGQVPETEFVKESGLVVDTWGLINSAPESTATNIPGVFAGGDSSGARAFVADAIANGKLGALAISCYLEGRDLIREFRTHQIGMGPSFSFQPFRDPGSVPVDLKKVATFEGINTLCFPNRTRRNNPSLRKSEEGRKSFGEVTKGLARSEMETEISRCFKCGTCTQCDLCFLICPDLSILKAGEDGYTIRGDYCKGCGMCASTCPRQVIDMGESDETTSLG
jgi:NADPH-dependent glutamate synthase beta subunit-like oxidoreductase/Pyruvate/2-oxoacid:ferredoxin oxidoreductase delta subunit